MAKNKEKIFYKADYFGLFVLNAAGMVLELVASRLMSPYFGNSNFVWTAIIGIILLAGSLGNIIGGKFASRKFGRFWAGMLLLIAAIYIAGTPLVDAPILDSIKGTNMGSQFESILGSVVFFLIPSTILGIITPIIMKDRISNSKDKGKESGRITAIIAIGSLVGTFIGGFWLVPALGTEMIFVVTGITVMLTVPFIRPLQGIKSPKHLWSFVVLSILTLIVNIASVIAVNADNSHSVDESSISIDTEYGRIIIEDGTYRGDSVRYYKQSGAYSSATFLDEEKKYDLVFNYLKKYDLMFKYKDIKNVAMIGGAAYQYPKYLIKNFEDIKLDVIEIDPESTKIAKQYFFLQDLIDEYDPEGKRLGLYNEDGRLFLDEAENKYDAVLNDAFSGAIPVGTLATNEAAKTIKNSLTNKGVYMSNVLGAVSGSKGKFLRAEVKTLKEVFKYVYVVPVLETAKSSDYVNWMVIATDSSKYVPENALELDLSDAIVLTDDYNPIDSLIPSYTDE